MPFSTSNAGSSLIGNTGKTAAQLTGTTSLFPTTQYFSAGTALDLSKVGSTGGSSISKLNGSTTKEFLENMDNFFGSKSFQGAAQGVGTLLQAASLGWDISKTIKAQKLAKEQLNLEKEKFNEEKTRYNALESERKANNAHFSSAFADWAADDAKKADAQNLPTNRV